MKQATRDRLVEVARTLFWEPRCASQKTRKLWKVLGMKTGTAPAMIANVIVAAATDPKPKLRYAAGSGAGRVRMLRRLVPARIFDKQIRKINRMT